ncbi:hypothetical protein JOF53_002656 [Crossiella equi]|uniref:Uncharacterized protein n=1 Tax=Crossiella equi TaxID=130796 RepID=A0ABS5AC55_9PSEU|nr:hypothetical protein [Crossiella equi]MBP2473784.1 hypothetical protein [Crossiella equi]
MPGKVDLDERVHDAMSLPTGGGPAGWDEISVSYRMNLRAERCANYMEGFNHKFARYTKAEAERVHPLVVHYWALMYKGDFLYEQAQREGRSTITDHTWKRELIELVKGHEAWDETVAHCVEELERYYVLEGQVMLGEVELTEEVFREVNVIRSAVIDGLSRALNNIKGVPHDEPLFGLIEPWMVFLEITDDLDSYPLDRADDSFNALRLFVRMYGRDAAVPRMRAYLQGLAEEAVGLIAGAPRRSVLGLYEVMLLGRLNTRPVRAALGLLPTGVLKKLAGHLTRHFLAVPKTMPEPVAETAPASLRKKAVRK